MEHKQKFHHYFAKHLHRPRARASDHLARTMTLCGQCGRGGHNRHATNGTYDCVPAERAPGGAPVYKRRGLDEDGDQGWLLFSVTNKKWIVTDTEMKDARAATGWARTAIDVAPGTQLHEAGEWDVSGQDDWESQPSVTVTAVDND